MTQSLRMLGLLWWETFSTTTSEAISLAEFFDDGAPVNHDLLRQFATANRDAIKMTKETTYLIAYITYTCVESWVLCSFCQFLSDIFPWHQVFSRFLAAWLLGTASLVMWRKTLRRTLMRGLPREKWVGIGSFPFGAKGLFSAYFQKICQFLRSEIIII